MFKVELLIQAKDGVGTGTHSLTVLLIYSEANNLVNNVQHMINWVVLSNLVGYSMFLPLSVH